MQPPYRPGRRVASPAEQRGFAVGVWLTYTGFCLLAACAAPRDVAPVIVLAGIVASFIYRVTIARTIARYNQLCAIALGSLGRSDPERAEREFMLLRSRFWWPRFLGRITTYNLALTMLRRGRHEEAIAALSDADRRGGALTIDPALAATLSYVHSLRNEVDLAEVWLAEAKRRYLGRVTTSPFANVLAEVAVDLRRGRFIEVRRMLESKWTEMEHTMKGETLNPLRVLRAFATAQASGVRDAGGTSQLLAAVHVARPGEFDYLATSWPELATFMQVGLPGRS